MKEIVNIIYTQPKQHLAVLLLVMLCAAGCSKSDTPVPTPAPVPPTVSTPTGDIQSFYARDSLIAFGGFTYIKWLVTNDNPYTIVSLDGTKVGLYGDINPGILKKNTIFTLALNNNKTASLTVKVADSLTTALWNKGKRIRQTKLEYYLQLPGDTTRWIDTPIDKQIADQRTYFAINNRTSTVQSTANMYVAPPDADFIISDAMKMNMIWNGVLYMITSLTTDDLVLTYNIVLPGGGYMHARNTYKYE